MAHVFTLKALDYNYLIKSFRLKAKLAKLKKQHTDTEKDINGETFLNGEYVLPRIGLSRGGSFISV